MWEEWSLARNELADGFYPSVCVTLRVALDHLSIGVLASFSVVTVMHVVLWEEFISGVEGVACFARRLVKFRSDHTLVIALAAG